MTRPLLPALGALFLLSLLVGLPGDPGRVLGPSHLALSPDLALALAAACLAGMGAPRGRRALALALLLWLVVLVRLADLVAQLVTGRPFEPGFDLVLLPSLWSVLTAGASGAALGIGLLAGLALLFLAVWSGVRATGRVLAEPPARRLVLPGLATLAVVQGLLSWAGSPWLPFHTWDSGIAAVLRDQGARLAHAADLRAGIARALAQDPVAAIPADSLLASLRGRHVIVVWVESYGLSALADPRHGPTVAARLERMGDTLAQAGFHQASGLVASPVLGGRSWLAHGTFRAGIRQDQPAAQGAVLASGRQGLAHAFRRAGWHTAAAMPGLLNPWPEGALWGFDRVLRRPDFPYPGPAFGWSPVPDQAVLASLGPLGALGHRPTYLEVVLTSSHAPWTPEPPWLDAAAGLGDGSAYADADLTPDYAGMAGAYARTLDYSLRAVTEWLATTAPADSLVLVLGDHPALGWIAAPPAEKPTAVPLHVLSRDKALVEAARRDWALSPGLLPPATAPALPMEDMLERFLGTFSAPGTPAS